MSSVVGWGLRQWWATLTAPSQSATPRAPPRAPRLAPPHPTPPTAVFNLLEMLVYGSARGCYAAVLVWGTLWVRARRRHKERRALCE